VSVTQHGDAKPADLRRLIDGLAREVGFDLVAVTDAASFDADRETAMRRIDDGLMDGLPWFTKARVARGTNPDELLPGARSIISLGLNYYPGSTPTPVSGSGLVARYAQGRDYHRVMKGRMRRLVISLAEHPALQPADEELAARWYVDDGPMLDRAAANRAGIGWFGKNTNILTPQFGSWVFLGQVITDLELEPDAPLKKSCGSCVRCIEDCPTGAIVAPYVVDNARCISYLTIENRGPIPRELRPLMGDWVFGCDICQDVCPVNRKARPAGQPIPFPAAMRSSPSTSSGPTEQMAFLDLIELLEMLEDEFRGRFAGTPVMRAKRTGMRRNACVALGNLGYRAAVPALGRALRLGEPLVRGHAAWALGRIGGAEAGALLLEASSTETDLGVLEEIAAARGTPSP